MILVRDAGSNFYFTLIVKSIDPNIKSGLSYHVMQRNGNEIINYDYSCSLKNDIMQQATSEQKAKLFEGLAADGKKWDAEKKKIVDVFVPKDGDIVVAEYRTHYKWILIFKSVKDLKNDRYNYYALVGEEGVKLNDWMCTSNIRSATEEEKQRLFYALKTKGHRWNAETKQIENVRWRAKKNEGYYYVTAFGCVDIENEDFGRRCDVAYSIGNYFKTEEEAEAMAEKFKQLLKQ